MPAFTAITLDGLLEHGASKPVGNSVSHLKPLSKPTPIPNSNLETRHGISASERKAPCPQLKPALYATPEVTPLPGSPASFPSSPYIINHKRRGPRLLRSSSEVDLAAQGEDLGEQTPSGNKKTIESDVINPIGDVSLTHSVSEDSKTGPVNGVQGVESGRIKDMQDMSNGKHGGNDVKCENSDVEFINSRLDNSLSVGNGSVKRILCSPQRDFENEDFFDPRDSSSYTSTTDVEDNNAEERALRPATPGAEFYDAWEELSSDGGAQSSVSDVQVDLREMRLSLLMEIEKRKQAEESIDNMERQWEKIRQKLLVVGLTVPPLSANEDEKLDFDPVEDLSQQVTVVRFVSESIGRGVAKAEVEMAMEALIESKDFEIARLTDRLHYYEAMNQEMSHRNQEAIELARRNWQRRKRKQKWVWGSVAVAITLGSAALLWSFLPAANGLSSGDDPQPHEYVDTSE